MQIWTMRKQGLAATILLLVLPAALAERLVVLGCPTVLSGIQAAVGQDFANGAQLAVEDLNRQQLVIGGEPVRFKLAVEDDQVDPKQGVVVAQKFVDAHINGVIGHLGSATTYPASPVYERAGIPMVVASATIPKLAQRGFKTFFRVITNDAALNAALARYARQTLKTQTMVVIDDRTAYGQGLADGFVEQAGAQGIKLLGREYTSDHASDFSAILTRTRALNPDLIFYGGIYVQAATMLRQMQQLGLHARLMGGDMLCVPELSKLAGPVAVVPTVCGEGGVPLDRMPGGPAWKRRYDARFGAAAFQIFSPYSYDATMVLAQAMIKADSVDPKVYLPRMRDIDWDGVTRQHIRFGADGDLRDPLVTLSTFASGSKSRLDID